MRDHDSVRLPGLVKLAMLLGVFDGDYSDQFIKYWIGLHEKYVWR